MVVGIEETDIGTGDMSAAEIDFANEANVEIMGEHELFDFFDAIWVEVGLDVVTGITSSFSHKVPPFGNNPPFFIIQHSARKSNRVKSSGV